MTAEPAATFEALVPKSPHTATIEAQEPKARAPQQKKPPQWEAPIPQWRVALRSLQPAHCRESLHTAVKTQHSFFLKQSEKKDIHNVYLIYPSTSFEKYFPMYSLMSEQSYMLSFPWMSPTLLCSQDVPLSPALPAHPCLLK